jgi:hypothetical protein
VQIQIKECDDALETLTLTAAWEDISKKIFAQICPNFVDDPAAIIQSIHQVSYNLSTPDKKIKGGYCRLKVAVDDVVLSTTAGVVVCGE